MSGQLDGKTGWVVGAGGALGAAIAVRLAGEGAMLVLSGRDETSLAQTASTIREAGGRDPQIMKMNITDAKSVDDAASAIAARHGRIDILVNSTTNPIFGPFASLSDEDWLNVLNAKLLGYMRTCRAVLPHMVRQGAGSIVNVSGAGGHMPLASIHMPGSTANAGVNLLTKGLAQLHRKDGVRINALAPGGIVSPRLERMKAAEAASSGGNNTAKAGNSDSGLYTAVGLPIHIANMALFLASNESEHLTGVVLQADGGATPTL